MKEKELVQLALKGLCDEARKHASPAYLLVRLRDILGKTKYASLVKGSVYVKQSNVVQYVYNCYLAVVGLKQCK